MKIVRCRESKEPPKTGAGTFHRNCTGVTLASLTSCPTSWAHLAENAADTASDRVGDSGPSFTMHATCIMAARVSAGMAAMSLPSSNDCTCNRQGNPERESWEKNRVMDHHPTSAVTNAADSDQAHTVTPAASHRAH